MLAGAGATMTPGFSVASGAFGWLAPSGSGAFATLLGSFDMILFFWEASEIYLTYCSWRRALALTIALRANSRNLLRLA